MFAPIYCCYHHNYYCASHYQDTQVCEEVVTTAYNSWRKTTALDRSRVMKRLAALMAENLNDLAAIVTLEAGKPLAEARGEIQAGA